MNQTFHEVYFLTVAIERAEVQLGLMSSRDFASGVGTYVQRQIAEWKRELAVARGVE